MSLQKNATEVVDILVKNELNGGALFDPDELYAEVRSPTGTTIYSYLQSDVGAATLTRIAEGHYRLTFALVAAGTWRRQCRSVGPDFNGASKWIMFDVAGDPE